MERHYQGPGDDIRTVVVEPDPTEPGLYRVLVEGRSLEVRVRRFAGGRLDLLLGDRPLRAHVAADDRTRWVQVGADPPVALQRVDSRRSRAGHAGPADAVLAASTPAQVVAILAEVGDHVARGAPLVVLEAMKMEFRLTAPLAGVVKRIDCSVGQVVERGQALVELHPEEA